MSITVKRAKGYVDFCEDLELRSEWEAAVEVLEQARRNPSGRLGDRTQSDAAAAVRELEARMNDATVRIHLQSVSGKKWQELAAKHPPRDDNEQDQAYSVNMSTFFDALATGDEELRIPPSIFAANEKVSGDVRDFDPKAEWMGLADEMSIGQYGEFVDKFLELNRGVVGTPFSRAALLLTTKSEQK